MGASLGTPGDHGVTIYKGEHKMEFKKFTRRTFEVEAVRVTAENMSEVAEWCGGTVCPEDPEKTVPAFITVNATRPVNIRQTQAFAGDWVLRSPGKNTYKVYTNRSMNQAFVAVKEAS